MLGTELPCEPLPVGGLPLFCCTPPLGTDVAVGVRLVPVCVAMAVGVGEGVGETVGVGVRVTGVIVEVTVQLQAISTEFLGPVKVIVSFAGQVMLEGIVMFTETCFLGGSIPRVGLIVTPGMPRLIANQLRFLSALLFITVTMHCLQLVRFVGEAATTASACTKCAGAAFADLAPETSSENMTRVLKVISAKNAKSIGR